MPKSINDMGRKRKIVQKTNSPKLLFKKRSRKLQLKILRFLRKQRTALSWYADRYTKKIKDVYSQGKTQFITQYKKVIGLLGIILTHGKNKTNQILDSNNLLFYKVKRYFRPHDYLSGIEGGKFPTLERKIRLIPKSFIRKTIVAGMMVVLIFVKDTEVKKLLLDNFNISIDGIGSLGNLGASSWQVLATVISVGLATIGIILQALTQENEQYRKKLLLHHFFSKQELDTIIIYSGFSLVLAGLLLLFKEKLFLYPLFSEKIFFVFLLIIIFVAVFIWLIISSFYYLFPEKQDIYFDESLTEKLKWLIHENAKGLILIDYLNQQLLDFGFQINYLFDEKDKKNPNTFIIETTQKGSIVDIDIALLKKVAKEMSDSFVNQSNGKQIKSEIYVEYGASSQRETQPLAKIHKVNATTKIIKGIRHAVILSPKPQPPIERDMLEYQEWLWDNLQEQLDKENFALEKDNINRIYDFFDETVKTCKEYKQKYGIEGNTTIDKPPTLVEQLRRQFFVTLDSTYTQKKAIDPLFTLNYFPLALMQRAIQHDFHSLYMLMSDMVPWVYKKIAMFDHPRKKDLMENFLLSNLNFGEFYILGSSENFEENFKKRKPYLEGYLRVQINLIKSALILEDKATIENVIRTVNELIKESSYWQKDDVYPELSDEDEKPNGYISRLWKSLILGIQSWALSQYEKSKITKEMSVFMFHIQHWDSLFELTQTFSFAIDREVENVMGWDWWEIEEKSFIDRSGSFGGFEQYICKGFSLLAINKLVGVTNDQVQQEKRVIRDNDNYFKLLISDDNAVMNFINYLDNSGEGYFYLFENQISSLSTMQEHTNKLKSYLNTTVTENEAVHKQTIQQAQLDDTRIQDFQNHFLQGYQQNSVLRKELKTNGNAIVDYSTTTKKYFGQHLLLDKESFIANSSISYGSMASEYGKHLARIEDFIAAKLILDNKSVKGRKLFNNIHLKGILDSYLDTLNESVKENTIIFVLGSLLTERKLTESDKFEWSRENPRTYTGKYRGVRLYTSDIGNGKGVVVFNLKNSITLIQKLPDVSKGILLDTDNHVSFLIEEITQDVAQKIVDNDIEAGRKPASIELLLQRVRFWSFVGAEVVIREKKSIFKVIIQTEERKE